MIKKGCLAIAAGTQTENKRNIKKTLQLVKNKQCFVLARKKKNTGRDMQKWRRTREIAFFFKKHRNYTM